MAHGRRPNTTNDIFWQSDKENVISYVTYFNRLCELAISVFEWEGLPDTIDPRFLEMALLAKGYALFFKDDVMGYLALQCMIGGQWNVYNIPIERTAYASNGYQNRKTEKDSVLIYDNLLHTNEQPAIMDYAKRLYKIDRVIDVNVNAQKTPILITTPKDGSMNLTLKNVYQKYDGNAPVIYAYDTLNTQPFQVLNTGAPYNAGELYELRTNIWNEYLTYIGIPNIAIQKKERLIKDEVQRNNGGTVASSFGRLQARQIACDQINKMFPELNVSVHLRNMDEPETDGTDSENEEGDNDE